MAEVHENLSEITSSNEIDKIYEFFMKEWPISAYHCGFLKTCSDWRQKNPVFDVAFYRHVNFNENGIFIGILNSGHRTFGVIPYAREGYESELKKLLLDTKIIDWNKLPLLQGVLPRHYELIEDVVKIKGFNTSTYCESTIQILDHEVAVNYDISYPDDVYAKRLTTEDDIDSIYDLWTNKVIHTKEDIINIIEMSFAYGIFSKSNDELLCWIMLSHYGAIGTLYTHQKARKRGYAKILVKIIAKKIAEENIPPYTTIVEKNTTSISLFHSLGFKHVTLFKYVRVV